jgi:chromosome segregation ATPase
MNVQEAEANLAIALQQQAHEQQETAKKKLAETRDTSARLAQELEKAEAELEAQIRRNEKDWQSRETIRREFEASVPHVEFPTQSQIESCERKRAELKSRYDSSTKKIQGNGAPTTEIQRRITALRADLARLRDSMIGLERAAKGQQIKTGFEGFLRPSVP